MTEEQGKLIFDASASAEYLALVWTSDIDIITGLSKMKEIGLVNHQGQWNVTNYKSDRKLK